MSTTKGGGGGGGQIKNFFKKGGGGGGKHVRSPTPWKKMFSKNYKDCLFLVEQLKPSRSDGPAIHLSNSAEILPFFNILEDITNFIEDVHSKKF